jgi:hypothetical protein
MFRQSMFLVLGLMAALTLGCEKKEEAPAVPDAGATTQEAGDAADAHAGAAADAVKDAADKAGDAADEMKDAAKDVKIPGQ